MNIKKPLPVFLLLTLSFTSCSQQPYVSVESKMDSSAARKLSSIDDKTDSDSDIEKPEEELDTMLRKKDFSLATFRGCFYHFEYDRALRDRCEVIVKILDAKTIENEKKALESDKGNNNSEQSLINLFNTQEAILPTKDASFKEDTDFFPESSTDLFVLINKYGYQLKKISTRPSGKKSWSSSLTKDEIKNHCLPLGFNSHVRGTAYDGWNPILGIMYNAGMYRPKDYFFNYTSICAPSAEYHSFDGVVKDRLGIK